MAAPPDHDGVSALFVVERWLPTTTGSDMRLLHLALTEASSRFATRGENVTYLRSIAFRDGRVLSHFSAPSFEVVKAVNEAALAPFTSIDQAVELTGPQQVTSGVA